jgi:hypothetical protein
MLVLNHPQGVRKDEAGQKTVRKDCNKDVKKDVIKTGGRTMGEKDVPESPYQKELDQGHHGDYEEKERVKAERRPPYPLCRKTSKSRKEQPGEKYQGNRDLIAVKLGKEFPNGYELSGNGGYPCGDDGPDDKRLRVRQLDSPTYLCPQERKFPFTSSFYALYLKAQRPGAF